jgi:putative two-component system response regulator
MRLLIVDDNRPNVTLLEQMLSRAGYRELLSTREPEQVDSLCREWKPDLVLLDLHMPGRSGYEVLEAISDLTAEPHSLPVLVLTADITREARHRALIMGARDFINKPIDQTELLLRVGNLLRARQLQLTLEDRNLFLDEAVRARTFELEQARLESLAVLATMAEYHDYSTFSHTQRVGRTAAMIAQALDLPEPYVATLRDAAPLHDVGKIGVSDLVLQKPGRLKLAERREMMEHVEIGARILEPARSPVLRAAAEIARSHHERWDGQGYLLGLKGGDIPLSGRITAVADVFDALTHVRPYKSAWSIERARDEIKRQAGSQFDARVVSAFLQIAPDVLPHGAPDAVGLHDLPRTRVSGGIPRPA